MRQKEQTLETLSINNYIHQTLNLYEFDRAEDKRVISLIEVNKITGVEKYEEIMLNKKYNEVFRSIIYRSPKENENIILIKPIQPIITNYLVRFEKWVRIK